MHLSNVVYKTIRPMLFVLGLCAAFALSGCVNTAYDSYEDDATKRYNSKDLAKDWRSQFKNKQYPRDNDAEYYYPYGQYDYPQDNDAGYVNPYPKYDPEQDNSGFEYPIYFDD